MTPLCFIQVYKDELVIFTSGVFVNNSYTGKQVLSVNIYLNRRYQHGHEMFLDS